MDCDTIADVGVDVKSEVSLSLVGVCGYCLLVSMMCSQQLINFCVILECPEVVKCSSFEGHRNNSESNGTKNSPMGSFNWPKSCACISFDVSLFLRNIIISVIVLMAILCCFNILECSLTNAIVLFKAICV